MLSVLTVVTDPGEEAWRAQFEACRAAPRTYYTIVIVDKNTDRIVAVGTVFIERKFLRGLGSVGHIEDIAVDKNQQGKKLGLRIVRALTSISENSGCYKTILNCSDTNIRAYPIALVAVLFLTHTCVQPSTRSVATLRRRTRWCVSSIVVAPVSTLTYIAGNVPAQRPVRHTQTVRSIRIEQLQSVEGHSCCFSHDNEWRLVAADFFYTSGLC